MASRSSFSWPHQGQGIDVGGSQLFQERGPDGTSGMGPSKFHVSKNAPRHRNSRLEPCSIGSLTDKIGSLIRKTFLETVAIPKKSRFLPQKKVAKGD